MYNWYVLMKTLKKLKNKLNQGWWVPIKSQPSSLNFLFWAEHRDKAPSWECTATTDSMVTGPGGPTHPRLEIAHLSSTLVKRRVF